MKLVVITSDPSSPNLQTVTVHETFWRAYATMFRFLTAYNVSEVMPAVYRLNWRGIAARLYFALQIA